MENKKPRTFFGKLYVLLVGDEAKFNFDHRFINSISIGVSIFSFFAFVNNVFLDLSWPETFGTLVISIVFLGIYILSRVYYKVILAKWLALIIPYFLLSALWINSAGSKGPIPYAFFLLFLSIVLLTENWQRLVLLMLLAVFIVGLFYIEYKYPEILKDYKDENSRRLDMVISILLYYLLGGGIIIYAKSNYIKEKHNAQKSDELKSAFLANMSHEIRTPMNAIMGFTGLLRRGNIDEAKKTRYLQIVDDSVEYLLRLIDDILDISKIEADQMDITLNTFDLDMMMKLSEATHMEMLSDVKKEDIQFYYENPGRRFIVETDRARLEQILTNLIMNAFKFTLKGYVKFGFQPNSNDIVFYVEDTGIGIKKEHFGLVFERFRKVDDRNIEVMHRGTGIGLSIVKKVVELLGGSIWVESIYGMGSTFYFSLPLKQIDKASSKDTGKKKKTVKRS